MNDFIQTIDITWLGPFSWPGYESENNLPPIPKVPGVYLQTFEYWDGFIIYAAGITRRTTPERFSEHTRHYIAGEYNVLELSCAQHGIRKEIWHGWDYAKAHPDEFENRKGMIMDAVHTQLAGFRIFITAAIDLSKETRILERLEAGVMHTLYQQAPPFRGLPDVGMHLEKRKDSEDVIIVRNACPELLFGLPVLLEI